MEGFSLAEVLAALTIGAMVLVSVLGIYSRCESSVDAVTRRLDNSRLPFEVLQRIAEDIDRIITSGSETTITIENKFLKGFSSARMTILTTIFDGSNAKQTFEEIVWQTSPDYDNELGGLVLYRSHSGVAMEDKLLDEQKDSWERELFVPFCSGVTFFMIQAYNGGSLQDRWVVEPMPAGIVLTISFAEPFQRLDGTFDVPDTAKITRTVAVDRTRKISFSFAPEQSQEVNE
jgi:hypothetical protein